MRTRGEIEKEIDVGHFQDLVVLELGVLLDIRQQLQLIYKEVWEK